MGRAIVNRDALIEVLIENGIEKEQAINLADVIIKSFGTTGTK